MTKYYTRACNFYHNNTSKENIKKNISLPIGGNKSLSFDTIEVITRTNKKKINIRSINNLPSKIKTKVLIDINNISKFYVPSIRYNFQLESLINFGINRNDMTIVIASVILFNH